MATFSNAEQRTKGVVPSGEDRTQWIFEGDDWPEEQVQTIIEKLTPFIQEYREKYGFDMVNYFEFSYADGVIETRIYYMTRRSWRYHDQAFSFDGLLENVQKAMNQSLS